MRLIGWLLSSLILLLVIAAVGVFAAASYFGRDLPDTAQLAEYAPPITTRLHAADGRLMAEYASQNRLFVPFGAIPPLVAQAFVSAEDQRFYDHPGVDLQGVARAAISAIQNYASGRRVEGASTITQQVARNFFLTPDRAISRKIREMLLAFRIESAFTKQQILELYLNQIYLGRGAYGVAAASLAYFNKPLKDLTVSEAAFLAGLPKAPSSYDPKTRMDAAVNRRNYVIGRLLEDGAITREQADAARAEPLVTKDRRQIEFVSANYFAEEVRRELQRLYGNDALYQGGLSVRTSLDPHLQDLADQSLRDGLRSYDMRHGWRGPLKKIEGFDGWAGQLAAIQRPAGAGDWQMAVVLDVDAKAASIGFSDKSRGTIPFAEMKWARPWRENQTVGAEPRRPSDVLAKGDVILVEPTGAVPEDKSVPQEFGLRQIPNVQGALVALDPNTGRVMAITGGYDYAMSEFDRGTQAVRQPGSTFKPFVYLTALEAGYTPATIIDDAPITIDTGTTDWAPENDDRRFLGPMPLRVGVERSRNLMTVRLIQAVGLDKVKDTAERFGVYKDMPLLYSMALGAGATTPLQMATGFAQIANGGKKVVPTFIDRIQDRTGRTIYRHDDRPCEACGQPWADQATPVIPDTREQIADPVSAYQITSILQGVVQRGTASALNKLGFTLAGKTGTTNDAKDAWFVGFAPDLVVAIYVGFDDPKTLGAREWGSTAALPIFRDFMSAALKGKDVPPFRIPPGVNLVKIDRLTGQPAYGSGGDTIWEAFRPGTEPGTGYALDRLDGGGGTPTDQGTTGFGDTVPDATTGTGGLY
ncbi:penicillin-binding protein 1A [Inquilinus limosus]|uniref:Penicillin-binding protein 1A n=1 Tax=Inquilinus limosus MP06 TaxID=1398085 RepID=A0A0A0CXG1_9PROT|nr:penicillin-binding protein 1A [Inquilinus limosus]KGM31151.1 penicillin-binding protein [Inquilinus limosus MP06]